MTEGTAERRCRERCRVILWGGVVKCWRYVEDVYCVGWIDGEVVW